jgi:hypothetical protein
MKNQPAFAAVDQQILAASFQFLDAFAAAQPGRSLGTGQRNRPSRTIIARMR